MGVQVATPFYELVNGFFHSAMMGIAGSGQLAGHIEVHGSDVALNRDEIVRHFLSGCDDEWLWWVDSDQVPTLDTLPRLLGAAATLDAKVVGALVPIPADPAARPNLWVVDAEQGPMQLTERPQQRFFRGITGTGCLLTHRDVLEALPAPRFERLKAQDPVGVVGEDLSFTMRAEMAGFPVWVDTHTVCRHRKAVTFG